MDSLSIQANNRPYFNRGDLYELRDALRKLITDCVHAVEFSGSPSAENAVRARLGNIEQMPAMQED